MKTREYLSLRGLAVNVLAAHGASWLWLAVFFLFLRLNGVAQVEVPPNLSLLVHWLSANPLTGPAMESDPFLYVISSVVLAPVAEEALMRFLPLEMARHFGPRVVVATQLAVCMMLFGWLHGSTFNIFLQGVLGLFLSVLYLNNAKHRSVFAGYLSCVAAHALYNLSVILFA